MALPRVITPKPDEGERVRLLACAECGTIEEFENFTGPVEYDVTLNTIVSKHQTNGREHAPGALMDVAKTDWDRPQVREQLKKQIWESFQKQGHTGLPSEAYVIRNTFLEDAQACWRKHLRTPNCPDYKADFMQIVPDTADERRELGMPKFDRHNPRTKRYLCEYCPVHSLVQQAERDQAGLYDK